LHPEARNIPALQCIVDTIIAAVNGTLHPIGASLSQPNDAPATAQK
jgi:hypothetical protein